MSSPPKRILILTQLKHWVLALRQQDAVIWSLRRLVQGIITEWHELLTVQHAILRWDMLLLRCGVEFREVLLGHEVLEFVAPVLLCEVEGFPWGVWRGCATAFLGVDATLLAEGHYQLIALSEWVLYLDAFLSTLSAMGRVWVPLSRVKCLGYLFADSLCKNILRLIDGYFQWLFDINII